LILVDDNDLSLINEFYNIGLIISYFLDKIDECEFLTSFFFSFKELSLDLFIDVKRASVPIGLVFLFV